VFPNGSLPTPETTPWTYASSADAEVPQVPAPQAREWIASGRLGLTELELGLVFWRYSAPDKEGWTGTKGSWAKWVYVLRRDDPTGGSPVPPQFELRVPGAAGTADIAIAARYGGS
jgi:hypothetical protein